MTTLEFMVREGPPFKVVPILNCARAVAVPVFMVACGRQKSCVGIHDNPEAARAYIREARKILRRRTPVF